MGTDYTVEAQVTGDDVTGGLQFEITPAEKVPRMLPKQAKLATLPDTEYLAKEIFIKTLEGKIVSLSDLSAATTIWDLKCHIQNMESFPSDQQRFIYREGQLEHEYIGKVHY